MISPRGFELALVSLDDDILSPAAEESGALAILEERLEPGESSFMVAACVSRVIGLLHEANERSKRWGRRTRGRLPSVAHPVFR